MKKMFALLLAASMLLTAGCSKKVEEIKTVDETQTEVSRSEETQDDFAEFRDAGVWNDDMQGTYKGEKVDISFYASVQIPEYAQSVVVEGKRVQMDEDYRKSVLKGIFGEEDIYYHDLKHHTTEELQKELDELEKDVWPVIEDDGTTHEERDEEGIKKIQKYLAKSKSEYTKATDFRVDEYIAKRNGEWYQVKFYDRDAGSKHVVFSEITEKGPEGFWEDAAGVEYRFLESGELENTCRFSPREATQEVLSFAEKLGIGSYLVLEEPKHQQCLPYYYSEIDDTIQYTDEERVYGYDISFGLGLNNEILFGSSVYDAFNGYARVTDEGVVRFDIYDIIEPTRVTEHVPLLSLDKIQSAFKKELEKNLKLYCFEERKKFKFDSLEFGYVWQINDATTGEGAVIPAWILSDTSLMAVRLYVNAIDGTILDPTELIYGRGGY